MRLAMDRPRISSEITSEFAEKSPSVLAWGAPFQFASQYHGPTGKAVAGGLKASGFGSSGINGKDASFSNDSVSGTDKISKLWK